MGDAKLLLNVVDVEATCWDGAAPAGVPSEIIEIGLAVVDLRAGTRVARHRILVRPVRSTVSAFCTELTGLTQPEVDAGIGFAEACKLLAAEHQAGIRPWASWGDYDRHQFARQCQATGTAYPFGHRHVNAKVAFTAPTSCRSAQEWRRRCGSPDCRWKVATTGAKTTPGTSRHSFSTSTTEEDGRSTWARPGRMSSRCSIQRSSGVPV